MQTKIKIFGDQKLFEKGPSDAEMVAFSGNSRHLMFYKFIDGEVFFCTEDSFKYILVGSGCPNFKPEAMRMAIPDDLGFVYDLFKIGESARTISILKQNISNAIRRANCLDFIEREYFTEIMDDEEEPYEHCPLSWGDTPERYSKTFSEALQAKIDAAVIANKLPVSQLEIDGVPSFYIGMHGVCTHRMGHLDIPVWCKNPEAAINFINNYSQQKPKPKHWTVEDQKAGRLPEFLSQILFTGGDEPEIVEYLGENGGNIWYFKRKDGAVTSAPIGYLEPIETPDEKVVRLEDEYLNEIAKFFPEFDIATARYLYRAQLSGELSVPAQVKDGE